MNKKFYAAAAVFILLAASGCGKAEEISEASVSEPENSAVATESETQPDPLAPTETEENVVPDAAETVTEAEETAAPTEAAAETTAAETVTAEIPEVTAAQDETSTVVFDIDESVSDEELIAAAQTLFESACDTNWSFHVGCPYQLDYSSVAENDMGWQFYLITDEGINSLADVEADYYKVFSDVYPNDLSEVFIESNGRVYALGGERGADIYYVKSVITGIKERSEDEIVFNVENFYSGDDYTGEGAYSENADFSVVISEDGTWRAGLFNLPY